MTQLILITTLVFVYIYIYIYIYTNYIYIYIQITIIPMQPKEPAIVTRPLTCDRMSVTANHGAILHNITQQKDFLQAAFNTKTDRL